MKLAINQCPHGHYSLSVDDDGGGKEQPVLVEPDEVTLLKMRVDYWENEAKRYAVNAEYWRERAEAAESKLAELETQPEELGNH